MSPEHCETIDLEMLASGDLDTGRAAAVQSHVDACPQCAELAREVADNLDVGARCRAAVAAERDHDDIPATIGVYRVLRELGRGGMGIVYEAEDPALGRRIALKVLRRRVASAMDDAFSRLRKEAQLLASLNHPNITTVYSLEETEEHYFLTMELVAGHTLASRIKNNPLPTETALLIVREIAKALEAAHSHGIVHRDLKPHNVMAPEQGPAKVLDFGIATVFSRTDVDCDATGGSHAFGTPGFMSPEQLRGEHVDHRADIWAVGCILYECLTGLRPFDGSTPQERIRATELGRVAWEELPASAPSGIVELLEACLSNAPEDRPQSAGQIVEVIERELARPIFMDTGTATTPRGTGNLPHRVSRFVGRAREIEELRNQVGEHRLVSLIGPGGCGKSRLALEAALQMSSAFPAGCWLVELAAGSDPEAVPRRVAEALGIQEQKSRPVLDTVISRVSDQKTLLILDNCEHLLTACAEVVRRLLEECPFVRVIVTSREALAITGEVIFATAPLQIPPATSDPDAVAASDAAQLFLARVRAVRPEFEIDDSNVEPVRQICRRLDGLPLALELAAARARMLSPTEIAQNLDDRFRLLSGGSRTHLPRHRTLRASIDWSIGLLAEPERKVLESLSAFSGGWTLDAAEVVCTQDGVSQWEVFDCFARLLDKSLVERHSPGTEEETTRYGMLETIRHALLDRLVESGHGPSVRLRHRDFFLAMAEEAAPHLTTPRLKEWVRRLNRDHENLKSAISFSLEAGDVDAAMRIAGALGRFWAIVGNWTEGREIYASLLDHELPATDRHAQIKCLNWAGNLALSQGDYGVARQYHSGCLQLSREVGDRWYEGSAHNNLGAISRYEGDLKAAEEHHRKALAIREELDDGWAIALSLFQVGALNARQGRYDEALDYLGRSLVQARLSGDDGLIAIVHVSLGVTYNGKDDPAVAQRELEEGLRLFTRLGDPWGVALSDHHLADAALRVGNFRKAREHLRASLEARVSLDDRQAIAESLVLIADLILAENRCQTALCFLEAAASIRDANGIGLTPIEQAAVQRIESAARASCGSPASELEVAGSRWTMDEALAHARDAISPTED